MRRLTPRVPSPTRRGCSTKIRRTRSPTPRTASRLSQWLGHASYTLTLDTYGDWIPEQDSDNPREAPAQNPPTKVDNVVSLFVRQSG